MGRITCEVGKCRWCKDGRCQREGIQIVNDEGVPVCYGYQKREGNGDPSKVREGRGKGKWVLVDDWHVEPIFACDSCGCRAWGIQDCTKFCPNCGADMRREKTDDSRNLENGE